jgi:hypothetical protein
MVGKRDLSFHQKRMKYFKSRSENVAAGIFACRRGRHPAAREKDSPGETLWLYRSLIRGHADPPGWKPRLYVSLCGRRHLFKTSSMILFGAIGVTGVVVAMELVNYLSKFGR